MKDLKPSTQALAYKIWDVLGYGDKTTTELAKILGVTGQNIRYALEYLIDKKFVIKNDESYNVTYHRTTKVLEKPEGVEDYAPPAPSHIRVFINSNKRVQEHKSQRYTGSSGFRGASSLVGFDSW